MFRRHAAKSSSLCLLIYQPVERSQLCKLLSRLAISWAMVRYHIPNILALLDKYLKPNNPHHDALEAEYVAWIDEAAFLTDVHKKVSSDILLGG